MESTDTNVVLNSNGDHECVWATCPLTGRFVMDIADRAELNGRLSVYIEHIVRTQVTDLLQGVALHDARFRGKLIPSGSFYESTKVTSPNEFDYMYELHGFPLDSFVPKHVVPPIYRPTQEETPHKGYFTLEVHPVTSESASNLNANGNQEVMDAEVIFEVFFESLKTASRRQNQESIEQTMLLMTNMKRNGPAVTLSFTTRELLNLESQECPKPWLSQWFKTIIRTLKPGYTKHFNIQVDIVLAVPMQITSLKLNEGHIKTNFGEDDCIEILHLVPSGNCWKLSVAKQESRLIRTLTGADWRPKETVIDLGEHSNSNLQSDSRDANTKYSGEEISDDETTPLLSKMESCGVEKGCVHNQLSNERVVEMEAYGEQNERVQSRHSHEISVAQKCRRSCLIALKHLRDEHEKSDVMKKAILPTYPLKVAFVQECIEHPEDEHWTEDQLGGRVYSILDKIDTQSRDGSLTNCFLPNVPVLKRPNYNISKQVSSIKSTLYKDFKRYRCVSRVSILACMMGILAAGSVICSMIIQGISFCCFYIERNEFTCMFFNNTDPSCSHFSNTSALEICVHVFAYASLFMQHVWYLSVIVFRIVTLLRRCQRKLSFVCIPLGFQIIPVLAFVVFSSTGGFFPDEEYPDKQWVNIASLEAFYLLYEMACLIHICMMRQRNQSISECFGVFRKLKRLRVKRPAEPYFKHFSGYSKCSRKSF